MPDACTEGALVISGLRVKLERWCWVSVLVVSVSWVLGVNGRSQMAASVVL